MMKLRASYVMTQLGETHLHITVDVTSVSYHCAHWSRPTDVVARCIYTNTSARGVLLAITTFFVEHNLRLNEALKLSPRANYPHTWTSIARRFDPCRRMSPSPYIVYVYGHFRERRPVLPAHLGSNVVAVWGHSHSLLLDFKFTCGLKRSLMKLIARSSVVTNLSKRKSVKSKTKSNERFYVFAKSQHQ